MSRTMEGHMADQRQLGLVGTDESTTTCISKGRGCKSEGERTKGWDDQESRTAGQGGGHEECVECGVEMKDYSS